MENVLINPVYQALTTADRHLGAGTDKVRYFDEEVSPFAGFGEDYAHGFSDLHTLLPAGRTILYARPQEIKLPPGWQLLHKVPGVQMVQVRQVPVHTTPIEPLLLQQEHVEQMMALAKLTRPGPFGPRTIEFGHYHGLFNGPQLVAMTGQRLHLPPYTEISAVCTHPDHLGRGYASALVHHQACLIRAQGQIPFLHVRDDNHRAIEVYERLGFEIQRPMIFYFLERRP